MTKTDNADLPPEINLDVLFHKASLFDSVEDLRDAGFQIVRGSENRVTVFGHASAPGYLFKKFLRDVKRPYEKQLESYQKRVRGARALRAHLDALGIDSIVVPRKWLCKLPLRFRRHGKPDHVVVVEKCDLLERDDVKRRYHNLPRETIRDLCTIFFTFARVDFSSRNWPFTTEGKIAVIDTGYLKRITKGLSFRRKSFNKNVEKLLDLITDESRRYAKSLWDDFEKLKKHGGLSAKPAKPATPTK